MPKTSNKKIALPPRQEIDQLIARAVHEDVKSGDITSRSCIPAKLLGVGRIQAKTSGIFAGGPIAKKVFALVNPKLRVSYLLREGKPFHKGQSLMIIQGPVRSLLTAERTVLNFLQHLCAIATHTAKIVKLAHGVSILATRKTIPGLRSLQKYAVMVGGGLPHRQGLYAEVLLKNNHFDILQEKSPAGVVQLVRKAVGSKTITAEARTIQEALALLEGGANRILLDNMGPAQLRKTAAHIKRIAADMRKKVEIEASGGIGLHNVRLYAKTGVDRISIGELTHSVHALDLCMRIATNQ